MVGWGLQHAFIVDGLVSEGLVSSDGRNVICAFVFVCIGCIKNYMFKT